MINISVGVLEKGVVSHPPIHLANHLSCLITRIQQIKDSKETQGQRSQSQTRVGVLFLKLILDWPPVQVTCMEGNGKSYLFISCLGNSSRGHHALVATWQHLIIINSWFWKASEKLLWVQVSQLWIGKQEKRGKVNIKHPFILPFLYFCLFLGGELWAGCTTFATE